LFSTRMGNEKDDLLQTWKEISGYLDCDSRTCARWERDLGLPVYRFKGMGKSRVFAYRSEIDAWREKRSHNQSPQNAAVRPHRHNLKKASFIVLPLVVLSLAAYFFILKRPSKNPVDFRIEGSELVIVNDKGRELWRYDTGKENLVDESGYREHAQYRRRERQPNRENFVFLPHIMIADIDNDPVNEVLFSIQTQDEFGEGELLCFDASGVELWRFQVGKELVFGRDSYSDDYRISGFLIDDLDEDENIEITIIADHRYYFPTQLVVLDAAGKVKGEFWNSGRFTDLQFIDLDGNGKKELLVSGMNNEYKRPALAVFDADSIAGASPQSEEEYTCAAFEPGTEMYYLLFPRTDVDRLDSLMESMGRIDIYQNGRISLMTVISNIYYELDYDLKPTGVQLSNSFEQAHQEAVREGRIDSELNDDYIEVLKEGVRYFDGVGWVSEPSRNGLYHSKEHPSP